MTTENHSPSLHVREIGDGVMHLAGELDMATAPQLHAALQRLIDASVQTVILDMVDSTSASATPPVWAPSSPPTTTCPVGWSFGTPHPKYRNSCTSPASTPSSLPTRPPGVLRTPRGVTHCRAEDGLSALAHGLGAVLSPPMIAADTVWGALNLYSRQPEQFTPTDIDRAEDLAAQAAGALAVAFRLSEQTKLSANLETALGSRSVIDQAVGIIMGAQHCDADRAFEVLRNASQHRNEKLRDIATRIVASTATGPRGTPPAS